MRSSLILAAAMTAVLASATWGQEGAEVSSVRQSADPPVEDGGAIRLSLLLMPTGEASVHRIRRGHREGGVSNLRVPDQFWDLEPSPGCVFDSDPRVHSLDGRGTWKSEVTDRDVKSNRIRVTYATEGCHSWFLGISCGNGYLNLDYEVHEICSVRLENREIAAELPRSPVQDGGVVIRHPDCPDNNSCTITEMHWKLVGTDEEGRRQCFVVDGEAIYGPCRATGHDGGVVTVTIVSSM